MLFIKTQPPIKRPSLRQLRAELAADGWQLCYSLRRERTSFYIKGERHAARVQPLPAGGAQADIGILN